MQCPLVVARPSRSIANENVLRAGSNLRKKIAEATNYHRTKGSVVPSGSAIMAILLGGYGSIVRYAELQPPGGRAAFTNCSGYLLFYQGNRTTRPGPPRTCSERLLLETTALSISPTKSLLVLAIHGLRLLLLSRSSKPYPLPPLPRAPPPCVACLPLPPPPLPPPAHQQTTDTGQNPTEQRLSDCQSTPGTTLNRLINHYR